jgi:hypothetical protein
MRPRQNCRGRLLRAMASLSSWACFNEAAAELPRKIACRQAALPSAKRMPSASAAPSGQRASFARSFAHSHDVKQPVAPQALSLLASAAALFAVTSALARPTASRPATATRIVSKSPAASYHDRGPSHRPEHLAQALDPQVDLVRWPEIENERGRAALQTASSASARMKFMYLNLPTTIRRALRTSAAPRWTSFEPPSIKSGWPRSARMPARLVGSLQIGQ